MHTNGSGAVCNELHEVAGHSMLAKQLLIPLQTTFSFYTLFAFMSSFVRTFTTSLAVWDVARKVIMGILGLGIAATWPAESLLAQERSSDSTLVVDDFEQYEVDTTASAWKYVTPSEDELPASEALEEGERFHVHQEDGNKFLRVKTVNESLRLSQTQRSSLDWNVREKPYLSWRWRAHHLPEGASEKDQNDSGGAVYVTFGTDWLGRPKSIKYTYSSSLPIGTVVDFGQLYVIVVDSKPASGTGTWQSVKRNLLKDYDRIFGGSPPKRPLSVTIWSDSDTTEDWAEVDFDDIEISASPPTP